MSERMIERQRAKLGLSSLNGGRTTSPLAPGSVAGSMGSFQPSPMQAALAMKRNEEAQMKIFLQLLQQRDDSNAQATSGPTVPTALSRRMLHRQGVGYLDNTVAAIVSAAADRFLATVVQQSVACRDQRLKGVEMAREAARRRKRHIQHYQTDADDRRRRKILNAKERETANLAAIAAGDALGNKGTAPANNTTAASTPTNNSETKAKRKKKAEDAVPNGNVPVGLPKEEEDDDDESFDSIDEEEEYYLGYYGNDMGKMEEEGEVDDDTLILKDVIRPLEAWGVHVRGKLSLGPSPLDTILRGPDVGDDEEDIDDDDYQDNNEAAFLKDDAKDENAPKDSGAEDRKENGAQEFVKTPAASRVSTPVPPASTSKSSK